MQCTGRFERNRCQPISGLDRTSACSDREQLRGGKGGDAGQLDQDVRVRPPVDLIGLQHVGIRILEHHHGAAQDAFALKKLITISSRVGGVMPDPTAVSLPSGTMLRTTPSASTCKRSMTDCSIKVT